VLLHNVVDIAMKAIGHESLAWSHLVNRGVHARLRRSMAMWGFNPVNITRGVKRA
jgi:hypothetical protein